jgi:hypothetical protein
VTFNFGRREGIFFYYIILFFLESKSSENNSMVVHKKDNPKINLGYHTTQGAAKTKSSSTPGSS